MTQKREEKLREICWEKLGINRITNLPLGTKSVRGDLFLVICVELVQGG